MSDAENYNFFLEKLGAVDPHSAVKYMAHLAIQIQGYNNPESALREIAAAERTDDVSALETARNRDLALRAKFTKIADTFFDTHGIIGSYGTNGQSRIIWDVMTPRSR
jgi:hypothetical protein